MGDVLRRAAITGLYAGFVAGVLALPAGMIYDLLDGGPAGRTGPPSSPLATVAAVLIMLAYFGLAGAAAGMAFGTAGGALLGALRPALTGRPLRCRAAGLAVFGGLVGVYALVLALVGTSLVWWVLLCASELVVAVIVGAWRGPAIVDGPAVRVAAQS